MEQAVNDAVLAIVASEGEIPLARLATQLMLVCPQARVFVSREHGRGIAGFTRLVSSPALRHSIAMMQTDAGVRVRLANNNLVSSGPGHTQSTGEDRVRVNAAAAADADKKRLEQAADEKKRKEVTDKENKRLEKEAQEKQRQEEAAALLISSAANEKEEEAGMHVYLSLCLSITTITIMKKECNMFFVIIFFPHHNAQLNNTSINTSTYTCCISILACVHRSPICTCHTPNA